LSLRFSPPIPRQALAGVAAGDIGKLAFEGTGGETADQGNLRRPPYSYPRVQVLLRCEAWAGFAMWARIRHLLAQSNRVGIDINQKTSIPSGHFLFVRERTLT
jgi:hypothetical protein